jgi:hypothetical protein
MSGKNRWSREREGCTKKGYLAQLCPASFAGNEYMLSSTLKIPPTPAISVCKTLDNGEKETAGRTLAIYNVKS